MAEAKKTTQPKGMYISGKVPVDLWREFRVKLLFAGKSVNLGLEESIKEWLARN